MALQRRPVDSLAVLTSHGGERAPLCDHPGARTDMANTGAVAGNLAVGRTGSGRVRRSSPTIGASEYGRRVLDSRTL